MKIFTLMAASLLLSSAAISQNNPCPDIQSYAITPVTTGPVNCVSKISVYATGDVSSQKGLNIQVFAGPDNTGAKLVDDCFIVPPSSPSTLYASSNFTLGCNSTLTFVITRYTASNGNCQGGTCGTTITRIGTPSGGPLPIILSSFYVQRSGASVALSWKTSVESNAKEFIVERNDGNGFVTAGTVAATNNFSGSNYSFTDNNVSKTVSQYRLKLVDKDGVSKYSEIKTVKGTAAVSDFTIYPNPTVGTTKISVTDVKEATSIQLIDNSGRVLRNIEMKNSSTVELAGLQKGVYLIRITNDKTGESVTKKLSVVN